MDIININRSEINDEGGKIMSGRNIPTFEEMQRYVEDRIGRALIPSDDLSTHYSIVDNLHTFTWEVRNNGQI